MNAGEVNPASGMDNEEWPVYRQLVGGSHYYRIEAMDRFQELQRIGSRWVLHDVIASAYPERVRVYEMLNLVEPYMALEEGDWQRAEAMVK